MDSGIDCTRSMGEHTIMTTEYNDEPIGGSGVPRDVEVKVSELIGWIAERYEVKAGTTATFFHVCAALSHHVGDGLE